MQTEIEAATGQVDLRSPPLTPSEWLTNKAELLAATHDKHIPIYASPERLGTPTQTKGGTKRTGTRATVSRREAGTPKSRPGQAQGHKRQLSAPVPKKVFPTPKQTCQNIRLGGAAREPTVEDAEGRMQELIAVGVWAEAYSPEGRMYYYHTTTRATTWDLKAVCLRELRNERTPPPPPPVVEKEEVASSSRASPHAQTTNDSDKAKPNSPTQAQRLALARAAAAQKKATAAASAGTLAQGGELTRKEQTTTPRASTARTPPVKMSRSPVASARRDVGSAATTPRPKTSIVSTPRPANKAGAQTGGSSPSPSLPSRARTPVGARVTSSGYGKTKPSQQQQETKTKDTPRGDDSNDAVTAEWRERIVELYQQYNPSKLVVVDELLLRYKGREEELWRNLRSKYNSASSTPQTTPHRHRAYMTQHAGVHATTEEVGQENDHQYYSQESAQRVRGQVHSPSYRTPSPQRTDGSATPPPRTLSRSPLQEEPREPRHSPAPQRSVDSHPSRERSSRGAEGTDPFSPTTWIAEPAPNEISPQRQQEYPEEEEAVPAAHLSPSPSANATPPRKSKSYDRSSVQRTSQRGHTDSTRTSTRSRKLEEESAPDPDAEVLISPPRSRSVSPPMEQGPCVDDGAAMDDNYQYQYQNQADEGAAEEDQCFAGGGAEDADLSYPPHHTVQGDNFVILDVEDELPGGGDEEPPPVETNSTLPQETCDDNPEGSCQQYHEDEDLGEEGPVVDGGDEDESYAYIYQRQQLPNGRGGYGQQEREGVDEGEREEEGEEEELTPAERAERKAMLVLAGFRPPATLNQGTRIGSPQAPSPLPTVATAASGTVRPAAAPRTHSEYRGYQRAGSSGGSVSRRLATASPRRPRSETEMVWQAEVQRREEEAEERRAFLVAEREKARLRRQNELNRREGELRRIREEEKKMMTERRLNRMESESEAARQQRVRSSPGGGSAARARTSSKMAGPQLDLSRGSIVARRHEQASARAKSAPSRQVPASSGSERPGGKREFDTTAPIYSAGWKISRSITATDNFTEGYQRKQRRCPLSKEEIAKSVSRLQRHYSSAAAKEIAESFS